MSAPTPKDKLLSTVGLCARARKLVMGTPMVCEALRKGGKYPPLAVLEASDTSDNTHAKLSSKCAYYRTPLYRLPVTTDELVARAEYVEAEKSVFHRSCNFSSAACLSAVANKTRVNSKRIYKSMCYLTVSATVKISHAAARAGSCSNSAAICRKGTYAPLNTNGNEVGYTKGAVKHLLGKSHLTPVYNHGNGCGHTLISASRINDYRKLTAVHSGITACGGVRLRLYTDVVGIGIEINLSNVGAPVALKSCLSYRHIIIYLTLKRRPYVININRRGKFNNLFNRHTLLEHKPSRL